MRKPRRAPGDAASRLPFPAGREPSVSDFVDRRPPEQQQAEYQQFQTALIHGLHRQVLDDVEKVQMARHIIAQHQEPPAPARNVLTVKEFAKRFLMDRNEVLTRCRNGSILASQGNGPGSMWRISVEEAERYQREGPREPTRQRRR